MPNGQKVGTKTPFIHTPQWFQPASHTCLLPSAQDGSTGFGGAQAGALTGRGPAGGAGGGGAGAGAGAAGAAGAGMGLAPAVAAVSPRAPAAIPPAKTAPRAKSFNLIVANSNLGLVHSVFESRDSHIGRW